MNFMQDEMHQELQQMYQEFAENEVKPLAAEIDKEERFPRRDCDQDGGDEPAGRSLPRGVWRSRYGQPVLCPVRGRTE